MIAIVDYGAGNLRSIQKALEAAGAEAVVTDSAQVVRSAQKVVLPGVGAFRDAVLALNRSGLVEPVVEAARRGTPFLGVCLGYQLLFEKSYEDGETEGLGLFEGTIEPIRAPGLKIPHMGWNALRFPGKSRLFEGIRAGENVYFVHSYAANAGNPDDLSAVTEYGGTIAAAVERGNLFGVQFHPEKSGETGLRILRNFVRM